MDLKKNLLNVVSQISQVLNKLNKTWVLLKDHQTRKEMNTTCEMHAPLNSDIKI